MPCLDDWRSLIPDSVCSLLDDAHEFPWKCAELKVSLQCVGHLLKWAMLVPELEQPEPVCQQEIVDAEPGPLNDVDQFVKVQLLGRAALPKEKGVPKGDPIERHLLHERQLWKPELIDWRERHSFHRNYLCALQQVPRETGGQPREAESTDGTSAIRMGIEQLLDPLSDSGECGMESANDVILHVHSCTPNAGRRRLHAVVRLGRHPPRDSDTMVVFPDTRSTTPR
jgi:hypothetical protein